MFGKILVFIAIFNNVKCQFLPVTVSCSQPSIPSLPFYAKVCALPNPTSSVAPSARAAPSPWAILNPKMLAASNQQLVCPIEYTVVTPTALPLPIPGAPTAPASCCPPISIPSHCPAETVLQDYFNDLCWPEVLFDLPLGCLDPILSTYGTITDVSIPEIAPCSLISPYLPAASSVSSLAPTVSPLLPPLLPSESSCHFLKKISIPPPFI